MNLLPKMHMGLLICRYQISSKATFMSIDVFLNMLQLRKGISVQARLT